MKNLSKSVFLSVAVASALVASAVAEQSGVFLGAEVGYGGASVDYKTSYSEQNQTTGNIQGGRPYTLKYNGGGVKYGIVAGISSFLPPILDCATMRA